MARNFQQAQNIVATVPTCAGLALLTGQHQDFSPLCVLVRVIENRAVDVLQILVPATLNALSGCGLALHWFPVCPVKVLVAGWHFLSVVAGAV